MDSPPTLVSVSLSLPPAIPPIFHIVQLVNNFLLPKTVDAAVYKDLRYVIRVFGPFLDWTVGAMDGAAVRGRLDIIEWLHSNRSEGCSSVAFTGAAANGHYEVLRWLIQHFPQFFQPGACLVAAAENGHFDILTFLHPRVDRIHVVEALEVAAAAGQVVSLKALLPGPYNIATPFILAAQHGRLEVVEFLLVQGCEDRLQLTNAALKKAARDALRSAAKWGKSESVHLLLLESTFSKVATSRALHNAVKNDHDEVVRLLLEKWPEDNENEGRVDVGVKIGGGYYIPMFRSFINTTLSLAAERGNVRVMKLLVAKWPFAATGAALEKAAEGGQCEVVKFLLTACKTGRDPSFRASIDMSVERAASNGDVEIAQLLLKKCGSRSAGRALNTAVRTNNLEMVKIFAAKQGEYYKVDSVKVEALVEAIKEEHIEVAEILIHCSNQCTVVEAVVRLNENFAVLRTILQACELDPCWHLFAAAVKGPVGFILQLMDLVDTQTLARTVAAASKGQVEAVRMLLDQIILASLRGACAGFLCGRCDSVKTNDTQAHTSAGSSKKRRVD